MSETEYALAAHCGITFAGIKAASLFSLKKQCEQCLAGYAEHFNRRGFVFMILRDDGERILVYVYNKSQLKRILSDAANKRFLEREGYRYDSTEQALAQLKDKMKNGGFPHEIGIFLSYPLEDVKGFIDHPKDGVQLVGYWKVYEGAEQKKKLFDVYEKCTRKITERLAGGTPLKAIFRWDGSGSAAQ